MANDRTWRRRRLRAGEMRARKVERKLREQNALIVGLATRCAREAVVEQKEGEDLSQPTFLDRAALSDLLRKRPTRDQLALFDDTFTGVFQNEAKPTPDATNEKAGEEGANAAA